MCTCVLHCSTRSKQSKYECFTCIVRGHVALLLHTLPRVQADPLRSPFRESRSSASSRDSHESLGESRSSFQRTDPQRCSIRGPRDSFFRESRDDALRVSERQTMLRVLFDFQACDNDDISVRRGELVRVLNKDDDDWWWVENVHRDQGFVPRSFLWPCGCYGEYHSTNFLIPTISIIAPQEISNKNVIL